MVMTLLTPTFISPGADMSELLLHSLLGMQAAKHIQKRGLHRSAGLMHKDRKQYVRLLAKVHNDCFERSEKLTVPTSNSIFGLCWLSVCRASQLIGNGGAQKRPKSGNVGRTELVESLAPGRANHLI